jgi:hypothetical protein
LYTGPVGSASVAQQIHDYNVHIDSNDVFWMIPVSNDTLKVDFEDGRARLRVTGLQVFDDHDIANSLTYGLGLPGDLGFPYPKISPVPTTRATVSFDVIWDGILATAQIRNPLQQFEGLFLQTGATIEWSAEQPGFLFQSEAADPSRNLISVLGQERNGAFFV